VSSIPRDNCGPIPDMLNMKAIIRKEMIAHFVVIFFAQVMMLLCCRALYLKVM
jgi:hypothetical protein